MSLMTQAYLLERYGPRIPLKAVAEVLGIAYGTARNKVSAGEFPIKTSVEFGQRFAHYKDLAEYIDSAREAA